MDYFRTTSIRKWSKERIKEYFNNKGIPLQDSQIHSGATFTTARLSTLKKIYGTSLGEKIYLIIRDRIEREDDTLYRKFNGTSPKSQIAIPTTPLSTPLSTPLNTPSSAAVNTTVNPMADSHPLSMSDIDLGSPAIKAHTPPEVSLLNSVLSRLDPPKLSTVLPATNTLEIKKIKTDFTDSDERAKAHFSQLSAERKAAQEKYEDSLYKRFIEEHPPLLWHKYHIQYLLKSMGLPQEFEIDVDDFIFLTQEELEKLYPTHGLKLYLAIRSRFTNPNIKKIPIKKYVDDCV